MEKIKWIARVFSIPLFIFTSLFYFGYGFPFANIERLSLFEISWLIIIPINLIALIIGWINEKVSGVLIISSVIFGYIISLIEKEDPAVLKIFFLVPGVLYIIYSFKKTNKVNK